MKKNGGRELKGKVHLPRGGKGLSAGPPALGSREYLLPNSPVSLPGHICTYVRLQSKQTVLGKSLTPVCPLRRSGSQWLHHFLSTGNNLKHLQVLTLGPHMMAVLRLQCSIPSLKPRWWQQTRSSQEGPKGYRRQGWF